MSSTNKTTNLELSQFIGSDSPKWLTDYNADMEKIDAGYQTVKAQADATDLIVGGHTSSITSLQSTVTEQGTAISGLRTDVTGNTGSINTINELLGNGEPTTTNKTIIGAINEINSNVISLDDDKLNKSRVAGRSAYYGTVTLATVTADGVKSYTQLMLELKDTLIAALASTNHTLFTDQVLAFSQYGHMSATSAVATFVKNQNTIVESYGVTYPTSAGITSLRASLADGSIGQAVNNVFTDVGALVPGSGVTISVIAHAYDVMA